MRKKPAIVVAGPTASGKTSLGIELAKIYNGEVVSADSMQIYKGMDIATAKPTPREMCGIPHHLIDFVERDRSFSVADYVECAKEKIEEIHARGKIPIVVGGTGLYINSLVDNITFPEIKSDESIRKQLEIEAEEYGADVLFQRLLSIDPETASATHANNLPRVIRAIEVYMVTGKKLSDFKKESRKNPSPYKWCMLGINFSDRKLLYDRIDKRVDIMVENGLIKECREVYEGTPLKTAHQAIGYKELIPFFENSAPLSDCIEKIKLETRRYAKRQLTWFRKDDRICWIISDKFDSTDKIIENCKKYIANSGIL